MTRSLNIFRGLAAAVALGTAGSALATEMNFDGVTTVPVALGEGIPLFASIGKDVPLTHIRTRVFDFGFVQTTYAVRDRA